MNQLLTYSFRKFMLVWIAHSVSNFGGNFRIIIFYTQEINEWSLKQSDKTPVLIQLSGWVTSIQSSKDWYVGVVQLGSLISYVEVEVCFGFQYYFLSVTEDLESLALRTKPRNKQKQSATPQNSWKYNSAVSWQLDVNKPLNFRQITKCIPTRKTTISQLICLKYVH